MRITLEPTTDGRWQIWYCEAPEELVPEGMWLHTVRQDDLVVTLRRLIGAAQLADPARLRRRSKGSGG